MAGKRTITLKDIAREAGVSLMTVSRALRKHSNAAAKTQARIQQIADRLGYRPHPLVSALMSYRRSARRLQTHLSLGFITNFSAREEWRRYKLYQEFWTGAAECADRHGYRLEEFWLRESGISAERLGTILYHRNINGVLIAPLPIAQGHLRLDWEKVSAVTFGYSLARPALHRAVNHQFRSMRLAMRQLRKRGYRRPGLALPVSQNERVDREWLGSFLGEQQSFTPVDRIPPLIALDEEWSAATFLEWFQRERPDVIVSQQEEILGWLAGLGKKVPHHAGFVHLNCRPEDGRFAGIYQNGPAIGAVAVDFLVSMIQRNERGIPQVPYSLLVEGTWVDGPTLRKI